MRNAYLILILLAGNATLGAQIPNGQEGDASQNPSEAKADQPTEHPNPLEDARDRVYYPGDTERFKPLVLKLGGNILLDQKEIWTSPFHMHKSDAAWWLGIGAVTAALIVTDHKTINTFENSQGQVAWGNGLSNIGASYTLIPLVAAFYGYGVLADVPKAREVGVLGGETLLDSLIVVEVLKTAAGRNRPYAPDQKGQFFDGGDSFPSGHSIESWALASLIAHEYGRGSKVVPIVAYALASVVSAARFTAQKHYASDIVAGGAMGWFIGRYVYQTHMDHAIHKHSWMRPPQVVPHVEPGTGTFAVALAFGN